jgi:hypothetical protein
MTTAVFPEVALVGTDVVIVFIAISAALSKVGSDKQQHLLYVCCAASWT